MDILFKIKAFTHKCARVWKISRKPSMEEFKLVSKASSIGILILGLIGFLVALVIKFFRF